RAALLPGHRHGRSGSGRLRDRQARPGRADEHIGAGSVPRPVSPGLNRRGPSMRWSDIPFNPAPSTLRWFCVLGALALTGLAARRFFADDDVTFTLLLLGLAAAVAAVGLIVPAVLRPVFVGWMVLVYPFSWAISHLILACVFCCLFTPLALFFKLIGR